MVYFNLFCILFFRPLLIDIQHFLISIFLSILDLILKDAFWIHHLKAVQAYFTSLTKVSACLYSAILCHFTKTILERFENCDNVTWSRSHENVRQL